MRQLKQILIVFALTAISASAQGLISRVGPDTGGGGGTAGMSILRIDSFDNVRTLSREEIIRINNIDSGLSSSNSPNSYALDISNLEEITLKDGTVLRIEDIKQKLKKNRRLGRN
jgi:hypothetical protein